MLKNSIRPTSPFENYPPKKCHILYWENLSLFPGVVFSSIQWEQINPAPYFLKQETTSVHFTQCALWFSINAIVWLSHYLIFKISCIISELIENKTCRTLVKITNYTIGFLLLVRCLNPKYITYRKQQFSLHLFFKYGFLPPPFFGWSLPSVKTWEFKTMGFRQ